MNVLHQAVVSRNLDSALHVIQHALGIMTGDVAANVFSDCSPEEWAEMSIQDRAHRIGEWLKVEAQAAEL
jgi:hypothetical protein